MERDNGIPVRPDGHDDRGRAWELSNDRISAVFATTATAELCLRSLSTVDGSVRLIGRDTSLIPSLRSDVFPTVLDGDLQRREGRTELTVNLAAPEMVSMSAHIVLHDGQSLVRQWLEITPGSGRTFDCPPAAMLSVTATSKPVLHTVSGVQQQGGWKPADGAYRSFRLEQHPLDTAVHHGSGPRSTWWETPWSVLEWDGTGGLVTISEYGGQWQLDVEHDQITNSTSLCFVPAGITHHVAAGSTIRSPSVLYGPSAGSLDAAAAITHAFVRNVMRPAIPADFPWVQYNTWFSWFCELDERTLLQEADIAADLGIEVFYVDAGWWVGNPVRQDRFSSGLGNWTENRDKFPGGLRAFAEGIRARGMHFGIWVEPERVDLRTASTGSWQMDWLATNRNRYVGPGWPSDTDTAWLCFGHRATIDWAKTWIGDLVQALDVRWLKWDSNFWEVCTSAAHDHGTGDGEARQLAGVYEVMGDLRRRFPGLIIENCAGGGTRMDYALAAQTHTAWLNDATEPMHRSRFHSAGAAYLFPLEMNNAWVAESDYEKIGGHELTEPVIRTSVRSRMLGALGFSCRLIEWTSDERRIVREEIELYRRAIRPILATGHFSHLLPQPEIAAPTMSTPHSWEAYGITAADRSSAVILAFRNRSSLSIQTLRLTDLDPSARYRIAFDDGHWSSTSGASILNDGIAVECLPLESVVVELTRQQ